MSNKLKVSAEIHQALNAHHDDQKILERKASTLLGWMNNPVISDAQQQYVSDRYFDVMDQLNELKSHQQIRID